MVRTFEGRGHSHSALRETVRPGRRLRVPGSNPGYSVSPSTGPTHTQYAGRDLPAVARGASSCSVDHDCHYARLLNDSQVGLTGRPRFPGSVVAGGPYVPGIPRTGQTGGRSPGYRENVKSPRFHHLDTPCLTQTETGIPGWHEIRPDDTVAPGPEATPLPVRRLCWEAAGSCRKADSWSPELIPSPFPSCVLCSPCALTLASRLARGVRTGEEAGIASREGP